MTKKTKAKKIPKTFKTSWGAEYTVMVSEEKEADVTKYNSPTLQPTLDDLVEKAKEEKPTNKKK